MFKKKEVVRNNQIPARLIKKGDTNQDTYSYPRSGAKSSGYHQGQPYSDVYKPTSYAEYSQNIPELQISESYLGYTNKHLTQRPASAPNSAKTGRKKFAPSFLSRRRKNQNLDQHNCINANIEEEDETDIARIEDFDQESINSILMENLDDSQLNSDDFMYHRRVKYILSHYQKPPAYPGKGYIEKEENVSKSISSTPQLGSGVDAPLLRQLLKEKQLADNASMINFWNEREGHINDRLVSRTQNMPAKNMHASSKELFEKRKQHYNQLRFNEENHLHQQMTLPSIPESKRDTISEIMYPGQHYDNNLGNQATNLSASVPNLSMSYTDEIETQKSFTMARKPRGRIEPSEMEALIAHYRRTSLDTFEPYGMKEGSLQAEESSSSYVPPSPYMSAEIPDWLQIYAKASPDLDRFLKWEMFRYPELDCWQTMLKRLYKKELEQVVLWFEEYRIALCDELQRQEELIEQQIMEEELTQQQQKQQQQLRLLDFDRMDLKKTDV